MNFTSLIIIKNEPQRIFPIIKNLENHSYIKVILDGDDELTEEILKQNNIKYEKFDKKNKNLKEQTKIGLEYSETEYVLIVYASFYLPQKILNEFDKIAKEKKYDAVFHGMVSWTYGTIVQEPWLLPRASACYFFNKNKIDYTKISVHNDYPILENSCIKILKTNKDYCIHMFRDDDMEILTKKEINYATEEANEKYMKNYKIIDSRHILTEVIKAFIIGYIRMGGYKYGVPGVIYHIQHSIQRFLVWQKLWELQNGKNYELNRIESIAKRESLINENNKSESSLKRNALE